MIMRPEMKPLGVVPIFLQPGEAFWRESDLLPMLLDELQAMTRWEAIRGLRVGCAEPQLAARLRREGLAVEIVQAADAADENGLLPAGALQTLMLLAAQGETGPFLLRDFRRPELQDAQALALVKSWLSQPDFACLSTSRPVDHPAQMQQYLTALGTGYVHRFQAARPAGRHSTLPCPQPVPGKDLERAVQGAWNAATLSDPAPAHYSDLSQVPAQAVAATFDSQGLCTLHVPRSAYAWATEGRVVGGTALPGSCPAALVERSGRLLLSLAPSGPWNDAMAMVLSCVSAGKAVDLCLPMAKELPVPTPLDGPGLFFTWANYMTNEGNRADMILPFQSQLDQWASNAKGDLVNTRSGNVIFGRQSLPDCWEMDGALSMGLTSQLLAVDETIFTGRVRVVELGLTRKAVSSQPHFKFLGPRNASETAGCCA